jgi:hypothetical protein
LNREPVRAEQIHLVANYNMARPVESIRAAFLSEQHILAECPLSSPMGLPAETPLIFGSQALSRADGGRLSDLLF